MAEFQLDTSGTVHAVPGGPAGQGTYHPVDLDWGDLDLFTQAYIVAALYTEQEALGEAFAAAPHHVEPMGTGSRYKPGYADLAPESVARIIRDCREFREREAYMAYRRACYNGGACSGPKLTVEQAGRDFWFSRQGCGCGFWDGDWPEPHATALDELAQSFGEVTVTVGDDGKVWIQ